MLELRLELGFSRPRLTSSLILLVFLSLVVRSGCFEVFGEEWRQHELWMGVQEGSVVNPYRLTWDPHFESAADAVLRFCNQQGGCDAFAQLDMHAELVAQLRRGAREARQEIRSVLSALVEPAPRASGGAAGAADQANKGGGLEGNTTASWLLRADDTVLARHDARAAEVRDVLVRAALPLPQGDCGEPSDLQRAIGACPLTVAAEALFGTPYSAGLPLNQEGPLQLTAVGWRSAGAAWFGSGEMSHAAAAYLNFFERARDPSSEQPGVVTSAHTLPPAAAAAAAAASEEDTPNAEGAGGGGASRAVVSKEEYARAEVALGSVAATLGLLGAAQKLFLGATAFAEDPKLLSLPPPPHSNLNHRGGGAEGVQQQQQDSVKIGWASMAAALRFKASLLLPPVVVEGGSALRQSRLRFAQAARSLAEAPHKIENTVPADGETWGKEDNDDDEGDEDEAVRNLAAESKRRRQAAAAGAALVLPVGGSVVDPMSELGFTFFHLAHQGRNDKEAMRAIGNALRNLCPSLAFVAPHLRINQTAAGHRAAAEALRHQQGTNEKEKAVAPVRVGAVSNYLYEHSIGKMVVEVLFALSQHKGGRRGSQSNDDGNGNGNDALDTPSFEVHLLDQIGVDGRGKGDDHVHRFFVERVASPLHSLRSSSSSSSFATAYHVLPFGDLRGCQDVVSALQLDLLLYPDVGMEPLSFFLSFARLAPVQVVWWGHPDTTASLQVDYFLSLDDELPNAGGNTSPSLPSVHEEKEGDEGEEELRFEDHYHEQLIRADFLNTAMFSYDPAPTLDESDGADRDVNSCDDHDRLCINTTEESGSNNGDDTCGDKGGGSGESIHTFGLSYRRFLPPAVRTEEKGSEQTSRTAPGGGEERSETMSGGGGGSCVDTQEPTTHVYLVLGRLFKLHPDFDCALLGVLAADPQAVLALIQERHELWTEAVWRRLVKAARAKEEAEATAAEAAAAAAAAAEEEEEGGGGGGGGGESAASREGGRLLFNASECLNRVRFIHHWNYIRVLRLPQTLAVLDTWPYGGCLTALEALSNGRPVVTLPSPFVRGRFALAMYRQMGLAAPSYSSYSSFSSSFSFSNGGTPTKKIKGVAGSDGIHPPKEAATEAAVNEAVVEGAGRAQPTYPWGLVAADRDEFVRCVTAIGTNREHRRAVTARIRAAYQTALHQNSKAGEEWANLFLALGAQRRGDS